MCVRACVASPRAAHILQLERHATRGPRLCCEAIAIGVVCGRRPHTRPELAARTPCATVVCRARSVCAIMRSHAHAHAAAITHLHRLPIDHACAHAHACVHTCVCGCARTDLWARESGVSVSARPRRGRRGAARHAMPPSTDVPHIVQSPIVAALFVVCGGVWRRITCSGSSRHMSAARRVSSGSCHHTKSHAVWRRGAPL